MYLFEIFCFLSLLSCVLVFFQPNIASPLSLLYLGALVYGAPLFFRENYFIHSYIKYGVYTEPIPETLYAIYILFMGGISIALLNSLLEKTDVPNTSHKFDLSDFWAVYILQALLLVLFFLDIKLSFLTQSKHYFVERLGVLYFLTSVFTSFSLLSSVCFRKKREFFILLPALLFIVVDILIGYRTTLFLTVCSFLLLFFRFKPLTYLEKIKLSVMGGVILLSAFLYKPIYYSVKLGGINNIKFNSDTAFVGSEPFVVIGTFSSVLHQNYTEFGERSLESIFQYFPFARSLFSIERHSLNDFIQNQVFFDTEWGLASSGLGSLFVEFSWAGVIFYFLFVLFFIRALSCVKGKKATVFLYFLAPYILIYFHRNDWHFFLGVAKLGLLAVLMLFFLEKVAEAFYTFNRLRFDKEKWKIFFKKFKSSL